GADATSRRLLALAEARSVRAAPTAWFKRATVLAHAGRCPEALPLFRHAVDGYAAVGQAHHPDVAFAFDGIAACAERDDAIAAGQLSLALREATLGPDHPLVAYPLTALARLRLADNDAPAAAALAGRAVGVLDEGRILPELHAEAVALELRARGD